MSNNSIEHQEANQFACELLLPKKQFESFVENVSSNVGDIAKHFQAPSMAVRLRAKQLGYSGHNLR